jgi:hypothetical protein
MYFVAFFRYFSQISECFLQQVSLLENPSLFISLLPSTRADYYNWYCKCSHLWTLEVEALITRRVVQHSVMTNKVNSFYNVDFLENLMFAHLVNKLHTFYRSWKFITTSYVHNIPSFKSTWTRPVSLKSILILSFHLPDVFSPFRVQPEFCRHFSPLPFVLHCLPISPFCDVITLMKCVESMKHQVFLT